MHPPDPKESKLRRTVSSARKNKGSSSTAKGGKKTKEKPQLVTPLEYAQKLQSILRPPLVRKANYLKGKRIFYVGGDMKYASTKTRGRMDYVSVLLLVFFLPYFSRLRDRRDLYRGRLQCGLVHCAFMIVFIPPMDSV
jgi:hypothetical protein